MPILSALTKKCTLRKAKRQHLHMYVPNSIAAKLVCINDNYTQLTKIFFGGNCIIKFLQWVFKQKIHCNKIIKNHFNKELIISQEDEEYYNNTSEWWICENIIIEDKVRDHYHITGKYRGAAHKECNLQIKISNKSPVTFPNLEGYDGHIIFRELNNSENINIKVILKSTEKYMSFIFNKTIIFLDSMQFLKAFIR